MPCSNVELLPPRGDRHSRAPLKEPLRLVRECPLQVQATNGRYLVIIRSSKSLFGSFCRVVVPTDYLFSDEVFAVAVVFAGTLTSTPIPPFPYTSSRKHGDDVLI